jgi:hypothetical protein
MWNLLLRGKISHLINEVLYSITVESDELCSTWDSETSRTRIVGGHYILDLGN